MVAIFTGAGAGFERGSGSVLGKAGLLGSSTLGGSGEQLFLNSATGNLLINRQDEFLVGKGPDVALTRTYNSLGDLSDENQDNWRQGHDRRVYGLTGSLNSAGSSVKRVGADGAVVTYSWDGAVAAYVATDGAGSYDTLVRHASGVWIWTDGDSRITETYHPYGTHPSDGSASYRLVERVDTNGYRLTFSYTGSRLTQVATQDGGTTQYEWDTAYNRITRLVTSSHGRTLARTYYSYDGYNRLSSVTVDLSPEDFTLGGSRTYVTEYGYQGTSKLVASIRQSDGTKIEFTYASIGGSDRITSVKQWVDDSTTRLTRIDYDLANRITIVTDPSGAATRLVYDAAGNLVQKVEPAPIAGSNPIISAFDYNARGDVTAVRRFDGFANLAAGNAASVDTFTHDSSGNVLQETDGNNNIITRTYGAKNELRTETRMGSDLHFAANYHVTRYAYDAKNQLRYVVSPEGHVVQNAYNGDGQLYWSVEYPGQLYDVSGLGGAPLTEAQLDAWAANVADKTQNKNTLFYYDVRGNLLQETSYSFADAAGGPAGGGYRSTVYSYDQAGQLLSRTVTGQNPETFVYDGLGRRIAATDVDGATTLTLYRDGSGKVDTVTIAAGGNLVDQTFWPSAGDGARGANLVDLSGWAGEKAGGNLVDLGGWPANPNNLPGGYATVPGWSNAEWVTDETRWGKAIGPNGQEVAVIQGGQTNSTQDGGGNYTHEFQIDPTKAYEFTHYFQWTSASAHRTYFGLSAHGQAYVRNAATGNLDGNPYFAWPAPGEGLQVGRWYKITGYVLPEGMENVPSGSLGGIFDAETGGKVQDVVNFRWSETRPDTSVHVRFFNFYNEGTQGYYTNFYKPEVRQLNLASGYAAPEGWQNNNSVDDETRWARTIGPDGARMWAIQAGQTDPGHEGGGGFTNQVAIDGKKAYEFTYYFKKSDLSKHSIYFGMSAWGGTPWVKNAWDGNGNINPYFFAADPGWQSQYLVADRWYKVVGYVFAEGSQAVPIGQAGGVFDTTSGQKVADVYNYTWNESRPSNDVHSRFFDFYDEAQQGYSTYFGKPEIREFGTTAATPGGNATVQGWLNYYTDETSWARMTGPDGRPIVAMRAGQTDATQDGGGSYTNDVAIDGSQTYEFSLYFRVSDLNKHRLYLGVSSADPAYVLNADTGAANINPYFAYPYPDAASGLQAGRWYKIVGYVLGQSSGNIPSGSMGGIFDVETGAKVQDVNNFRWNPSRPNNSVHARFFNFYTESIQGQYTYFYAPSIRRVADTSRPTMPHIGHVRSDAYNRAGERVSSTESGDFVAGGTATYQYDRNGRLRTTTDATGNKSYSLYDKLGRRIAQVSHYGTSGMLTEYRYDANDRLVATARYTNLVTPAQLATLADTSLDVELASIRPPGHPADIWSWIVHDKEGRVLEAIEGDGSVTTYGYDGSNRLINTTAFANKLSEAQLVSLRAANPTGPILPIADPRDSVARNFYDKDGRLVGVLDGEGYLSSTTYDKAGQKVWDYAYATATIPAYRASGTFAELFATTPGHAEDRQTRYVHDGRGLLRFVVDSLSWVTEYLYTDGSGDYTGFGPVRQTIRHAIPIASLSSYTYASVKNAVAFNSAHGDNRVDFAVYDEAGRLAYAIDAVGALTGYRYDAEGRVVRVVQYWTPTGITLLPTKADMDSWVANYGASSNSRVARNYWNDRGELRFTVDPEGYASRFDYDAEGRKIAEIRFDNPISVTDATTIDIVNSLTAGTAYAANTFVYHVGGKLAYAYDGENNHTYFSWNANGTLAWEYRQVSTVDESRTLYSYDNAGRLKAKYAAYGLPEEASIHYEYDGLGNLVRVIDPRGNSTYHYYDRLGQSVLTRDAENHVTETSYNAFGEVASVTRRYNKTTSGVSTSVRPTVAAHGSDATSLHFYDRRGLRTTEIDPEGIVTSNGYGGFGELITVTRGGATTSFGRDKLGRIVATTDAEGYTEYYWYNAFGDRTQVQNKLGGITQFVYDRRGLLYYDTVFAPIHNSSGAEVSPNYIANLYQYDARGNAFRRTEAYGQATSRTTFFTYDKTNRLIETRGDVVTVLSQADHLSTSSVTPTERFKYDKRGNLIETIDANGARTLFYYDKRDRKTVAVDAVGTYSTFSYDGNGNLLATRVYGTQIALPATPGGTPPSAPGGEYRETTQGYDKLDRLTSTSVAGLRTGAWNGSVYATSSGVTITANFEYDARGNLIRSADANGAATYSYYDKANRKYMEVDRENYLTVWGRDANGNAISERRYATRITGTPTISGFSGATTHADDRVTMFTYDRNGRRLTETRESVLYNWLLSSGQTTGTYGNATITYAYNGLGEVTRKTEATGEYIDYSYDNAGRLIQERRHAFTDLNGASVRPSTRYHYDGLNNLTATRQGAEAIGGGDRTTGHIYGIGGRLDAMTDAAGATYYYYYDAAGNRVRESYNRYRADGSVANDHLRYTRDALGRVTVQQLSTWVGYWVNGDSQHTAYNAYGEVSHRGLNGLWQEQFAYDGAGRLWRTNSGDGVWRYFIYDSAGNQTLQIESEGTYLAGYSLDQVLGISGYNPGSAYVDGINVTINLFDKRGQATQTRLPFRQLDGSNIPTLTLGRGYNAFGEVAWEIDARGAQTDYSYNTMGRMVQKWNPAVNWTSESGGVGNTRPTEIQYYDQSGRMIGYRDPNGNLTSRILLAGTGYGDAEALVTAEYHADGGVFRTYYDHFGDARILRNELNQDEIRYYDILGRLVQQNHRGGLLVDYYAYDLLGQRIKHWNSMLGAGNVEVTDHDMQGRVTRTVAFGGDTTTTVYSWDGGIATNGMGTFGGWRKTTTYATGYSGWENQDVFGHTTYKVDLGGHGWGFSYDYAGRLIQQVNGAGQSLSTSYYNTGLAAQITDSAGPGLNSITGSFAYDAAGNRTYENYTGTVWHFNYGYGHSSTWQTLQNATFSYDLMGRMTNFTDRDAGGNVRIIVNTEYDLAGNVRRTNATYPNLAYPQYGNVNTDHWYRYDAMNRMVIAEGNLENGQIVRSGFGVELNYDAAGRRRTQTRGAALTGYAYMWVWAPGHGPGSGGFEEFPQEGYNGWYEYQPTNYWGSRREEYGYAADGALSTVHFAETGYVDQGYGYVTDDGVFGASVLRAAYTRDAMERITRYNEYDSAGGVTQDRYNIVYDGRSQITSESVSQKKIESGAHNTYVTHTSSYYGAGGVLNSTYTDNYRNGSDSAAADTSTSFGYAWWDDARVSVSTHDADTGSGSNPLWYSTYHFDGLGRIAAVDIADGRRRTVNFASAPGGQMLSRFEKSGVANNPVDNYYFANGVQVGELTNNGNNDLNKIDYGQTLHVRNWTNNPISAPFRWNTVGGVTDGRFGGAGYDPINPMGGEAASTGGRYTVREGDSLSGIARNLWGDASLWYMLAEANGLAGDGGLIVGTSLAVPSRVTSVHNNAGTFKVFDPNRALGDLSPTAPKPPKKANNCGMLGAILLVVIAVAVTVVTAGAAVAALTPGMSILTGISTFAAGSAGFGTMVAAGAIGGAAGSIASQAFGVATGLQDKFSWKGVAMSALSGAIGAGVGASGAFARVGSTFARGALTGASSSALTQGIAVATGLQKKFDWAGVAAAGLGGGVGSVVGKSLGAGALSDMSARNIGANLATSAASAIANAAARSLIQGTSFGDNIMAALPDVIGSTLGNMIAEGIAARGRGGEILLFGSPQEPGSTEPAEQTVVVTGTRTSPISPQDLEFWNDHDVGALRLDLGDALRSRDELRAERPSSMNNRRLARLEATISGLESTIGRLTTIHNALVRSAVGQTVRVGGEDYVIRGPSGEDRVNVFRTRRDAAKDGIALAFYVTEITGDPCERGARIVRVPGGYTYRSLEVGTTPTEDRWLTVVDSRGRHVRGQEIPKNTPFLSLPIIPGTTTTGFFHIHPRSTSSQDATRGTGATHNNRNTGFSQNDRDTFSGLTDRTWESFLGGSDGSFDVMRRNPRGRIETEALGAASYFDTARTRRIY